jgi:hypothetical protein
MIWFVLPGELSPDRLWRWTGESWVPTGALVSPTPGVSTFQPPYVGASRPRPWLAIAGGVTAMLAAVLIVVASAVPYVHYTDSSSPSTVSIFDSGFGPSNWFALEPVGVALLVFVAGIVLVAWMSRLPRAVASGVLIALGAQTLLMFAGYVLFTAGSASAQHGPGAFVGMLAGLLTFAGGVSGAVAAFAQRDAPAA